MSRKAHGQVRRSQVITTYGPGALIDLPRHSAIVGGLETFTGTGRRFELHGTVRGVRVYDDYAHHPTEVEAALHTLKVATGNPHVSALIFWPDPGDEDLTAAQIVDKALAYRPFAL